MERCYSKQCFDQGPYCGTGAMDSNCRSLKNFLPEAAVAVLSLISAVTCSVVTRKQVVTAQGHCTCISPAAFLQGSALSGFPGIASLGWRLGWPLLHPQNNEHCSTAGAGMTSPPQTCMHPALWRMPFFRVHQGRAGRSSVEGPEKMASSVRPPSPPGNTGQNRVWF